MGSESLPLWSVTLTVAGEAVDVCEVRAALDRLLAQHPFLSSVRYSATRAELRYWDEARDVDDAAAMALRLWPEHRVSAGLPAWSVAGLEVVDRATVEHRAQATGRHRRGLSARRPRTLDLIGDIAPW
ncbi:hypothetical protein [Kineococcus rhizosphaerae]|uniref:Uncharacterized protein n=1 Tax=Kineococcus rhizosphaerae TaxID=559628 RepID=A0A2T0R7Q5_9ACTN|nr:hypothetical protein [Kineococcus rhizosphaerae]PRY17197.1 hypothetical protein CLV37_102155 [Kineococcus rhizosphaerae]